ncbi:hypothetical protein Tco_1274963 [Tanacetum coccineum]
MVVVFEGVFDAARSTREEEDEQISFTVFFLCEIQEDGTLKSYFDNVDVTHKTFTVRTPEQLDIVENKTARWVKLQGQLKDQVVGIDKYVESIDLDDVAPIKNPSRVVKESFGSNLVLGTNIEATIDEAHPYVYVSCTKKIKPIVNSVCEKILDHIFEEEVTNETQLANLNSIGSAWLLRILLPLSLVEPKGDLGINEYVLIPLIWDNEDVHDLGSVETEFPAIVFNDTLTSETTLSCEPTISSLNDEIDFRISFDDSDDEDYTIILDKNSSQQAATRNKGKIIVNSPPPTYDQEPEMVAEDDALSKEKDIDKLMALISLSFKKIYKPTNNNLRTSSNTGRANQDNTLIINRGIWTCIKGMSETKMGKGCSFSQGENANVDSIEADNELSKTNQLMFKDLKKFQAKLDRYHDVNYASKVAIDCAKAKGDLISYKIESEKSFNEYTRKINDLNQTISEMKKELFAHQETISIMSQEKEAQIKFYKTREDKEIENVIALENKVKALDDIVYKTGQSIQTMNMLNRNYKTSFVILEFPLRKHKERIIFLNEIDRLSREYYYADHMNAILGMYTTLDESTNLQCDYLDQVFKCERLEKELSKSKTMSKSFEALQKHAINLELALQQCKGQIKNDKAFNEN